MFVRTFAGDWLNTVHVRSFGPAKTKAGGNVMVARMPDGEKIVLDPFYFEPGRLERVLGVSTSAVAKEPAARINSYRVD